MTTTKKAPAKNHFCVWADHARRVYQEVQAAKPRKAYQIAKMRTDHWVPCAPDDDRSYRVSPDVQDLASGKFVRVRCAVTCKTCKSEIVVTVNESNFGDGECNGCEYARYKSQSRLFLALNGLFWSHALHDREVPVELWEKVEGAIQEAESLFPHTYEHV